MHTRPVWAEISRNNLISNYLEVRRLVEAFASGRPAVDLMAVVKANAYGHGIVECAPAMVEAGAHWIGVTCVDEGVRIRAVCPDVRILVMSGVWHGEADAAIEHRLTPVVWESFHLELLKQALADRGVQRFPVHLEIDTGMSRQGVRKSGDQPELEASLRRFLGEPAVQIEGLMTHFSDPEDVSGEVTRKQIEQFERACRWVVSQGVCPAWIHAGNSATLLGALDIPAMQQMVTGTRAGLLLRPGLALFGYAPRITQCGEIVRSSQGGQSKLRPVLAWKTRVTSLRAIQSGETAGYNRTFRASRRTRLALLPVGYADGVNRMLSNCGSVLVRGQRAAIAGRVSMDQTIIDVTDIAGVEIGDEVVLIGNQGGDRIDAYEIADLIGTIPYEVLCAISSRVPRVVVD